MGASYRPRGRLRQTRIVQAPHLVVLVSHPLGGEGVLHSCPVFGTPEKALLPPLESMRAQRSVSNQKHGSIRPCSSDSESGEGAPNPFIYLRGTTKGATS